MKIQLYTALVFILILGSCTKDKIMVYDSHDAMSLYIDRLEADSILYNFSFESDEIEKDTLFIKTRLQGRVSDNDREVNLTALAGTNALEGIDFELPTAVLKAGESTLLYPVILNRTPSLKLEMKTLILGIKENSFFEKAGLGQELINLSYSISSYKIKFNDFLSEPAYWSTISSQVGAFSVVKLKFMLEVYARKDFILTTYGGTFSQGEFLNMRSRLSYALIEYEKTHGLLIDEMGQQVTF